MSYISLVKVELIKLLHKRTTLLVFLNFLIPLFFGIGMLCGLTFYVAEDVYAVSSGLSALGFTVDMLGKSKYILYFVAIIISAISFAGELEKGQMKSEVLRICSRFKILIAKYTALLIALAIMVILFVLWSMIVYYLLLRNGAYSSGEFTGPFVREQLYSLLFTFLGTAVATAITILLGVKLKMFSCFTIAYIIWFVGLYTDFFGRLRLLIPYNLPEYTLEQAGQAMSFMPYVLLFIAYCCVLIAVSVIVFQRMDIKA